MKLATLQINRTEQAALLIDDTWVTVAEINRTTQAAFPTDLQGLLSSGLMADLNDRYRAGEFGKLKDDKKAGIPKGDARFGPLYRHPPKIWGIGLNYALHAADLDEKAPEQIPASFMKPSTALIGPGDTIVIPHQSRRTTAEAELGIIIGKSCKNVEQGKWLDVVAGFTTIIDMTAEDILRQNPRYLTLAKSFDTFFSFGPVLITPDEIDDVAALEVSTVINGRVHAANTVSNMTFPPDRLVAFHSQVMRLLPGDVISTGTPGAVVITPGDIVECQITGFEPLRNIVGKAQV